MRVSDREETKKGTENLGNEMLAEYIQVLEEI
jgi:hypothetical protein